MLAPSIENGRFIPKILEGFSRSNRANHSRASGAPWVGAWSAYLIQYADIPSDIVRNHTSYCPGLPVQAGRLSTSAIWLGRIPDRFSPADTIGPRRSLSW